MASTLKRVTAENVRAALARRNLTRGALMPILGLSYTAVQRRYQGDHAYDIEELGKISNALNVPVKELVDTSHTAIIADDSSAEHRFAS